MEQNFAAQSRRASFATSAGGLFVYPLWKGGVADALQQFGSVQANVLRKLAVAAVLPEQSLDLNEMDALEEAGLLVVEVPQAARNYQLEQLAAYVEEQIDGPESITTVRAVAQPLGAPSSEAATPSVDQPLSEDEETALLQSINDPDADEGGV